MLGGTNARVREVIERIEKYTTEFRGNVWTLDTSRRIVLSDMERGTCSSLREVVMRYCCNSGSLACDSAMDLKSVIGGDSPLVETAPTLILDRASATGLRVPLTCRCTTGRWDWDALSASGHCKCIMWEVWGCGRSNPPQSAGSAWWRDRCPEARDQMYCIEFQMAWVP